MVQCGFFEFKCEADNKCISTNLVCDKKSDCSDGADEVDCGEFYEQ